MRPQAVGLKAGDVSSDGANADDVHPAGHGGAGGGGYGSVQLGLRPACLPSDVYSEHVSHCVRHVCALACVHAPIRLDLQDTAPSSTTSLSPTSTTCPSGKRPQRCVAWAG